MSVTEWLRLAPDSVKEWLRSVHVGKFLHERRKESFQMQGRYDGAMSAECKDLFKRESAMLSEMIGELDQAEIVMAAVE